MFFLSVTYCWAIVITVIDQNAEMARFKKSQIFPIELGEKKSKNYLLVERALFLFRRRCLRDTICADFFFSLFFSNFPLFVELKSN